MTCQTIANCRICSAPDIEELLFLGNQPLANAVRKSVDQAEETYPLTLAFCKACGLVQIKETVAKSILFSHYVWVTGTSSTAKQFADVFYRRIRRMGFLRDKDFVLEIASNDGTFLKPFQAGGFKVLGVDPAANIAQMANKAGIETVNAFWNPEAAAEIVTRYGNPRFVFARNVIAHVSDLHGVVSGLGDCLNEDGIGAVEFHYAEEILQGLQYDSIYHEHLCYYSVRSITNLLIRLNLQPFHVEFSPISGGAVIVFFSKGSRPETKAWEDINRRETESGINSVVAWRAFADRCRRHRDQSREQLSAYHHTNVVGFGASARSSTYLNFCGFTTTDIQMIIDNNPIKQGFYTPGSTIPIVPMDRGLAADPNLIFILAWNFKDELVKLCRKHGYTGRFLVPFPNEPYLL